ncbi:hypothetical protein BT67DRAFT_70361 [Trichocladium antarcticum]|uniref:Uncharacterized protein n=1 Tax=Trichocladium antarcticum TaxID=1450529 RepID=A0AAN6ZCS3_9PEZI|nr:hypothetical protein BT67DRAFT_70361 [Trichocladium antarcticum]
MPPLGIGRRSDSTAIRQPTRAGAALGPMGTAQKQKTCGVAPEMARTSRAPPQAQGQEGIRHRCNLGYRPIHAISVFSRPAPRSNQFGQPVFSCSHGTLNPRLGFAGAGRPTRGKGCWRLVGPHARDIPCPTLGLFLPAAQALHWLGHWMARTGQATRPGSLDESTAAFPPFNSLANQTVFPLYIFRPKDERQSHSPTAPTSFRSVF